MTQIQTHALRISILTVKCKKQIKSLALISLKPRKITFTLSKIRLILRINILSKVISTVK
jgi:hypothetical protein